MTSDWCYEIKTINRAVIATASDDFQLYEGFYFCSCLYPNGKNQIVSTHNATANHSTLLQWRLEHRSSQFLVVLPVCGLTETSFSFSYCSVLLNIK